MTAADLVDILIKIPANKRKNYIVVETLDYRDIEVTVDRDKQTVTIYRKEEK